MAVTSYRRGSGAPLILLHPVGGRWQVFAPILERLAGHRDVIALDLPGFGDSDPDSAVAPSVSGYTRWLARYIRELGLNRPHVAGCDCSANRYAP